MVENKSFQFSIQTPFLSHEKCDDIIKSITETEQVVKAGVGSECGDSVILEDIRTAEEWYLFPMPNHKVRPHSVNNDWGWLQKKIFDMVKITNESVFKFHIEEPESELKLIKYTPGGFYTWHTDMGFGNSSLRKLTAVVQLTDPSEYEGGELQFALQDRDKKWFEVPKEKGTLTIFPTFLSHRVKPVTSGTRHVLQEFFIGNHFV